MAIIAEGDGRGGTRYWDDESRRYISSEAVTERVERAKQEKGQGLFDKISDAVSGAVSGAGEAVRENVQQAIQRSREGSNQHLNALWNANVTLETDADKAARISEASKILGLDDEQRAGVMRAGLSDDKLAAMALREARRKQLSPEDWENFSQENPATASYLSKQENMSVSWDDVKKLRGVEYNLNQVKKQMELMEVEEKLNELGNAVHDYGNGLASLSADQRVELEDLMRRHENLSEDINWFSVGGVLGGMLTYPNDIASGTTMAAIAEGAVLGGIMGSVAPGGGTLAGALAGAGRGLVIGIAGTAGERADNIAYLRNLMKQDKNGQQMDESSAYWGGKMAGIGTAGLNMIGLARFGARFPSADKVVNNFLKTTSPKILGDPVMRDAAWKSYLSTFGKFGASVAEQDIIFGGGGGALQYGSEKFAEALSGLDYGKENEFSFENMWTSAKGGMYQFLPMAATMGGISTFGGRYLNNKVSPKPTTPLASSMGKTMDALADTKTAGRSPEATKEFINENLKGMTSKDMNVTAKGFMQFWQEADPEHPARMYEEAQKFGITPEELNEKAAMDEDLSLDMATFMTEYKDMKPELRDGFFQEVRDPSLNNATPKEFAESMEQMKGWMDSLRKDAETVVKDKAFDKTSDVYKEAERIARDFAPKVNDGRVESMAEYLTAYAETAEKRGLLRAAGIDSAADALRMVEAQYSRESATSDVDGGLSRMFPSPLKSLNEFIKQIEGYKDRNEKFKPNWYMVPIGDYKLKLFSDDIVHIQRGNHDHPLTYDEWETMVRRLDSVEEVYDTYREAKPRGNAVIIKFHEDGKAYGAVLEIKDSNAKESNIFFIKTAVAGTDKFVDHILKIKEAGVRLLSGLPSHAAEAGDSNATVPSHSFSISMIQQELERVNKLKKEQKAVTEISQGVLAKWIPSAEFKEDGRLTPIKLGEAIVRGYKNSNYASLAHEMTHHWTWLMENAVARGNAPEDIVRDLNILREYAGAEEGKSLNEAQYEKIADAFETYALEGKAPSLRLVDVFNRLMNWMKQLYRKFKMDGVEINDDVRGVFDRMLAADDEIARAESFNEYKNLFGGKENLGKSDLKQFATIMSKAHDEAIKQINKRVIAEVNPAMKEKQQEVENTLREDISSQMILEPVYGARAVLDAPVGSAEIKNKLIRDKLDGSPAMTFMEANGGGVRLDRASVYEQYGKGTLPEKWLTNKDGLTLGELADYFYDGKAGGDKLFEELTTKPTFAEELNNRTRAKMVEFREQELGTIREAAMKAVYNDYSLEAVAVELELMIDKADKLAEANEQKTADMIAEGREKAKVQNKVDAAKEKGKEQGAREQRRIDAKIMRGTLKARMATATAKQYLDNEQVGNILSWQKYAAKAMQKGREATRLMSKGDYDGAIEAKNLELLYHAMAKEAGKYNTEVQKDMRFFERFNKRGLKMKGVPHEFNVQLDNLLKKFGLLTREPLKPLDGNEAPEFAKFIEQVKEDYFLPDIPEDILMGESKNYTELSMTEFRQLRDAVESIYKTGRNQDRVMAEKTKQTITDRKNECIEQLATLPQWMAANNEAGQRKVGVIQKLLEMPSQYVAPDNAKMEFFLRLLDKGKERGAMIRNIWNPIQDGLAKWTEMQERIVKGYRNVLEVVEWSDKDWQQARDETFTFDFMANPLTRYEIIMMGFNIGNEGNRDRLRYYFMTENQRTLAKVGQLTEADLAMIDNKMMTVLGKLTAKDWKLIQGMWDMLETYAPEIRQHEIDCSGVDLKMVEAMPSTVISSDGQVINLKGGYYPIRYDSEKSIRVANLEEAHALFKSGAALSMTTDHHYTNSRALRVNRPLLLEINTLFDHLQEVGYDLCMRKPIMDVHRVLKDERIQAGIGNVYGQKLVKSLNDWLRDLASSQRETLDVDEKRLKALRTHASVAYVGFRSQALFIDYPQAFLTAAWQLGARTTLNAVVKSYMSFDYINQYRFVAEKSAYMRDKLAHVEQNIADLRGSMFEESKWRKYLQIGAFAPDLAADFLVQIPVWREFYEKNLMAGLSEKEAITRADAAVRKIGTDNSKAGLARIQRGKELSKLIRPFNSYFNGFLNRVWYDYELGRLLWADGQKMDAGRLYTRMFLLGITFPAMLEGYMRGYALNNDKETDPEKLAKNKQKKAISSAIAYPLGMSPIWGRATTYGINKGLGVYADFELSPIESVVEKVFGLGGTAIKYWQKEEITPEDDRKIQRSIMEAASVGLNPWGQPYPNKWNDMLFNMLDVLDKHDFTFNDLLMRRQNQK